jgi:hypothetical protein
VTRLGDAWHDGTERPAPPAPASLTATPAPAGPARPTGLTALIRTRIITPQPPVPGQPQPPSHRAEQPPQPDQAEPQPQPPSAKAEPQLPSDRAEQLRSSGRAEQPPPSDRAEPQLSSGRAEQPLPSGRAEQLRSSGRAEPQQELPALAEGSRPGQPERAYLRGDFAGAITGYIERIRTGAADDDAWVGLTLSMAAADHPGAPAMTAAPETLRALYTKLPNPPEPPHLATWLAGALTRESAAPRTLSRKEWLFTPE